MVAFEFYAFKQIYHGGYFGAFIVRAVGNVQHIRSGPN